MSESIRLITQSFLIGFTAAATLGPIAILCIQRTLKYGWRIGVASGFGVALADATYGLVGALGLKALTDFLVSGQRLLGVTGGLVLVIIGIRSFRSSGIASLDASAPDKKPPTALGAVVSILLLTLSNPVTIMFFSAVYAGLTVGGGDLAESVSAGFVPFALGVFAGSFSWWVILVTLVNTVRQRFNFNQLRWLNWASGLIIAGFGVWVLVRQFFA